MSIMTEILTSNNVDFLRDYGLATIRLSIPLALAALGGLWSERSGVLNIALEGMLLTGAFVGAVVTFVTKSLLLGVIGACILGGTVGLLHAYLCVTLQVNQIVSALGINLSVTGLTAFFSRLIFQNRSNETLGKTSPTFSKNWINYSMIETIFSPQNCFLYLLLIIICGSIYLLFYTHFGLSVRAVGQSPQAAETAGISVGLIRYVCVIFSGCLCGLGGAYLSLIHVEYFAEGIIAGKGFIALAAVIFGRWHPLGVVGACLLFGATEALQLRIQALNIEMPYQLLNMLPYLTALFALLGLAGKSAPPEALGIPYNREETR